MDKINIIAIFGKSGSGKDTIQKYIVNKYNKETKSIISCTTRPKRDYEQNGIDYYFLSSIDFAEKVLNGEMLEATEFNGWFYGTSFSELDKNKINVGVFNPSGIEALLSDGRINVIPVEVYTSDKIRLIRSLNREKNPNCYEICRRYFTDEKDFDDIDDIDSYTIINENNLDYTYTLIDNIMAKLL